jgi:hypothetical protein
MFFATARSPARVPVESIANQLVESSGTLTLLVQYNIAHIKPPQEDNIIR